MKRHGNEEVHSQVSYVIERTKVAALFFPLLDEPTSVALSDALHKEGSIVTL